MEHARKDPGVLTYSSSGVGTPQQLAVEFMAKQAKVKLKHVSFKGGAPAKTALIGGHVEFTAGAGSHLIYVKQDKFRMLILTVSEGKRDSEFPDVPTLKELGCQDAPPYRYILLGPKGIPDPIYEKHSETFREVAESPDFQKVLANLEVAYDYKEGRQLEKDVRVEYEFYKTFLEKTGASKK